MPDSCPHDQRLERIERGVTEVKELITGNGTPEDGIAFRMKMSERQLKELSDAQIPKRMDRVEHTNGLMFRGVVGLISVVSGTGVLALLNLILR